MSGVGFLGPAHTFSERAARHLAKGRTLIPCDNIASLFELLSTGKLEAAVAPFENSAAGYVPAALDAAKSLKLALCVEAEHNEEIRFSLYRRKGDETSPLARVRSHIMSLKQCADWLRAKGVATDEASSNGIAFLSVRDAAERGVGAIGPSELSDDKMTEVETDLQGKQINRTRFLLLSRQKLSGTSKRLVCESESLAQLFNTGTLEDVRIADLPVPTGTLGLYRSIVELAYRNPVSLARLGDTRIRTLLAWG